MVDPPSADHFSPRWRAAGARVATVMRLLPPRHRFRSAVRLSGAVALAVRHTPHFRQLVRAKLDSSKEIALHLLLHVMTTNDVPFVPEREIDGYDAFLKALRSGRGLLLVSPHASLTLMVLRPFHDDALRPLVIGPDPQMRILGTSVTVETLQRSPTMLLQVRTKLREGRLICTMLDRAEPEPGTTEFATARGAVIFAPALLHVAARCGAHVAFTETHLEGSRLRARIVMGSSGTGEGYEREFAEFVRSAIDRRAPGVTARSRSSDQELA